MNKRIVVLLILGLVALSATAQDLRGLDYHHYQSFTPEEKVNLIRGLIMGSVLTTDVLLDMSYVEEAHIADRYGAAGLTVGDIHEWFTLFYKRYDWSTPLYVAWVNLLKRKGGVDL